MHPRTNLFRLHNPFFSNFRISAAANQMLSIHYCLTMTDEIERFSWEDGHITLPWYQDQLLALQV